MPPATEEDKSTDVLHNVRLTRNVASASTEERASEILILSDQDSEGSGEEFRYAACKLGDGCRQLCRFSSCRSFEVDVKWEVSAFHELYCLVSLMFCQQPSRERERKREIRFR